MGILDSVSGMLTSEGKDVYRCEDCGETTKVDTGVDQPECSNCGSTDLTFVNRV